MNVAVVTNDEKTIERGIMERSIFDIQAEFCKAMGNATRLQIMHILRELPMTVSEIMQELNQNQSTVSRQLSILRSVGVVAGHRRGNEMVYQLANEKISEVCDLVRTVLIEQTQKQSITLRDM
jgi:DNA-binding transcriptional ArsR family regulator